MGAMVRVVSYEGNERFVSAPMLVIGEVKDARLEFGACLRPYPALVLATSTGEHLHAYRYEVERMGGGAPDKPPGFRKGAALRNARDLARAEAKGEVLFINPKALRSISDWRWRALLRDIISDRQVFHALPIEVQP